MWDVRCTKQIDFPHSSNPQIRASEFYPHTSGSFYNTNGQATPTKAPALGLVELCDCEAWFWWVLPGRVPEVAHRFFLGGLLRVFFLTPLGVCFSWFRSERKEGRKGGRKIGRNGERKEARRERRKASFSWELHEALRQQKLPTSYILLLYVIIYCTREKWQHKKQKCGFHHGLAGWLQIIFTWICAQDWGPQWYPMTETASFEGETSTCLSYT